LVIFFASLFDVDVKPGEVGVEFLGFNLTQPFFIVSAIERDVWLMKLLIL